MGVFVEGWYKLKASISPDVPHKNSFNLIRLIAASMVVFSHSFVIVGAPEPHIGGVSLGTIGVWVFFILSGYLVQASWTQYPRFNIFMAKRALRIFPGLFIMLLFIVVLGVFFTNYSPQEYFLHQSTIAYFNNLLLYVPQYNLPGVFEQNPYPSVVNGSIWTLAYEFTMYIILAALGAYGFFKKVSIKKIWVILMLVCLFLYGILNTIPQFSIFFLDISNLIPLTLLFFTGVLAQEHFSIANSKPLYGALALILFIFCSYFIPNLSPIFAATFLAYAIFALGTHPFGSWMQKYGDYSYGIYIYSFPIQQALERATLTSSVKKMFAASLLISALLAALSWFLVEKPALNLKRKLRLEKYPVTQTDEAW